MNSSSSGEISRFCEVDLLPPLRIWAREPVRGMDVEFFLRVRSRDG